MFPRFSDIPHVKGTTIQFQNRVQSIWNRVLFSMYAPKPLKTDERATGLNQYVPNLAPDKFKARLQESLLWFLVQVEDIPKQTTWEKWSVSAPKGPYSKLVISEARPHVYQFTGAIPVSWLPFLVARILAPDPADWADFLTEASLRVMAPLLRERFEYGRPLKKEQVQALLQNTWGSPYIIWQYNGKNYALNVNRQLVDVDGNTFDVDLKYVNTIPVGSSVPRSEQRQWMEWAIEQPVALPYPQWHRARDPGTNRFERLEKLIGKRTIPNSITIPYSIERSWARPNGYMIYLKGKAISIDQISEEEWDALIRRLENF